jgi:hypothetical protein
MAGGIALMTPELHDRRGVGLMLGGTAVGLAAGAALTPRLELADLGTVAGATAAGGTLGLSEALLFAWSGRASGGAEYAGAALVGGGVGASLGLLAVASPSLRVSSAPAAAGFAAWGTWMGAFAGSLFQSDAHEITLGGLAGANVGFLSGYALLNSGVVDARDFGWLSLAGALGTVAGAGVGAPFSTRAIRAGMAAGPAAGMLTGALVLPRLRALGGGSSGTQLSFTRVGARVLRAFGFDGRSEGAAAPSEDPAPDRVTLSSEIMDAPDGPGQGARLLRKLGEVVQISDCAPLVGALPTPDQVGPPPLLFGLTGRWR